MTTGYTSRVQDFILFPNGQFLLSSFEEGRHDKPYTGGNWDDYVKGKAEKENYEKNTGGGQPRRPSGGGIDNDGRSGNFWGKLILFVVGLLLAIPSFFTAILAGTILFVVFKTFTDPQSINMQKLYAGAFWSMFAYLATAAVMSFILPRTDGYGFVVQSDFYIERIFLYFFSLFNTGDVSTAILLKFHLPCLLIAAIVLNVKMGTQLGKLSFLKALLVVAVVVLPSFIVLLYLMQIVLPAQLQYFVTLV